MTSPPLCLVRIFVPCRLRKERQRIAMRLEVYMRCHVFEKTLNSTNRAVAVATFGCPKGIPPHVIAGYGMRFSSPSTPDVFEVLSGFRSLLYVAFYYLRMLYDETISCMHSFLLYLFRSDQLPRILKRQVSFTPAS